MSFKDPRAITIAGAEAGANKASLSPTKAIVSGFLGGAYIAFGGLVAISVSSGLDPKTWGTLPTLFTGAVFALGLILVVIAGSELLTGTLLGSLFVAYFLAVKSGVLTAELPLARLGAIAEAKAHTETDWQIFL